ncbi:MAG: hypothetical protein CMB80_09335 [Flammeovirgaceae bacterium]|nr:hypothetical protein [Flammeovirgaceae bacterium]|tara:strand:- start:494 stop:1705 length:1212 start_codon:yes stop_codon:yes gene_type:complete
MLCLNAGYIGTEKHLIFEPCTESFSWVNTVPPQAWTWGFRNTPRMFEDVACLLHEKILPLIPEPHRKATQLIWSDTMETIPWKKILPSFLYDTRLKAFLKQLGSTYKIFYESPYAFIFEKYSSVTEKLQPARINIEKWKTYLNDEKSPTVQKVLRSFLPINNDFAILPQYDYCKTSTGRAVMRSGPQILTLPSAYRNIIVPTRDENAIIQVDFISLEPRVALFAAQKSIKYHDVYRYVLDEVFDGKVTRPHAKLATLCALYGVSLKKLQQMMPNENAAQVVQRIKKFFGVRERTKILRRDIVNNSVFYNYFGRNLKFDEELADHVLFSRFVQSTAVDVSMLGFCQLLESNELKTADIRPLFVLHDALILELPFKQISMVREYCNTGITIEQFGTFPLEVKMVE